MKTNYTDFLEYVHDYIESSSKVSMETSGWWNFTIGDKISTSAMFEATYNALIIDPNISADEKKRVKELYKAYRYLYAAMLDSAIKIEAITKLEGYTAKKINERVSKEIEGAKDVPAFDSEQAKKDLEDSGKIVAMYKPLFQPGKGEGEARIPAIESSANVIIRHIASKTVNVKPVVDELISEIEASIQELKKDKPASPKEQIAALRKQIADLKKSGTPKDQITALTALEDQITALTALEDQITALESRKKALSGLGDKIKKSSFFSIAQLEQKDRQFLTTELEIVSLKYGALFSLKNDPADKKKGDSWANIHKTCAAIGMAEYNAALSGIPKYSPEGTDLSGLSQLKYEEINRAFEGVRSEEEARNIMLGLIGTDIKGRIAGAKSNPPPNFKGFDIVKWREGNIKLLYSQKALYSFMGEVDARISFMEKYPFEAARYEAYRISSPKYSQLISEENAKLNKNSLVNALADKLLNYYISEKKPGNKHELRDFFVQLLNSMAIKQLELNNTEFNSPEKIAQFLKANETALSEAFREPLNNIKALVVLIVANYNDPRVGDSNYFMELVKGMPREKLQYLVKSFEANILPLLPKGKALQDNSIKEAYFSRLFAEPEKCVEVFKLLNKISSVTITIPLDKSNIIKFNVLEDKLKAISLEQLKAVNNNPKLVQAIQFSNIKENDTNLDHIVRMIQRPNLYETMSYFSSFSPKYGGIPERANETDKVNWYINSVIDFEETSKDNADVGVNFVEFAKEMVSHVTAHEGYTNGSLEGRVGICIGILNQLSQNSQQNIEEVLKKCGVSIDEYKQNPSLAITEAIKKSNYHGNGDAVALFLEDIANELINKDPKIANSKLLNPLLIYQNLQDIKSDKIQELKNKKSLDMPGAVSYIKIIASAQRYQQLYKLPDNIVKDIVKDSINAVIYLESSGLVVKKYKVVIDEKAFDQELNRRFKEIVAADKAAADKAAADKAKAAKAEEERVADWEFRKAYAGPDKAFTEMNKQQWMPDIDQRSVQSSGLKSPQASAGKAPPLPTTPVPMPPVTPRPSIPAPMPPTTSREPAPMPPLTPRESAPTPMPSTTPRPSAATQVPTPPPTPRTSALMPPATPREPAAMPSDTPKASASLPHSTSRVSKLAETIAPVLASPTSTKTDESAPPRSMIPPPRSTVSATAAHNKPVLTSPVGRIPAVTAQSTVAKPTLPAVIETDKVVPSKSMILPPRSIVSATAAPPNRPAPAKPTLSTVTEPAKVTPPSPTKPAVSDKPLPAVPYVPDMFSQPTKLPPPKPSPVAQPASQDPRGGPPASKAAHVQSKLPQPTSHASKFPPPTEHQIKSGEAFVKEIIAHHSPQAHHRPQKPPPGRPVVKTPPPGGTPSREI